MSVSPERLQYLLNQNARRRCTKEEMQELYTYIDAGSDNELYPQLDEHYRQTNDPKEVRDIDWDFMLQSILKEEQETIVKAPIRKLFWRKMAVAASVVLAISLGTYWLMQNQNDQPSNPVVNEIKTDVEAPATNKAIITLADGTVVPIDSLNNGVLAQQSNSKVVKLADGKIVYQTDNATAVTELQYNTLYNPEGSKVIDMELADGSHVWLNAGSSVTYPVAFVGNERNVTIKGEAYFEVARNTTKPFKVNIGGKAEVEVLGTHFNINAYSDEPSINTSLLEGKVKVSSAVTNTSVVLKPGEQSVQNKQGTISIKKDANMDEVMAWKNGRFSFGKEMDIKTVMRQVARWYGVTVEYKGQVNAVIGGSISREVSVAKVLQMLELTGTVEFVIEDKKVIVKNK
jgi:transmembrane sensor